MTLRGRNAFWRVWVAQAVSVTGDGMHRAALLWWAASTRSTSAVAVLALCSMVPLIVCSPWAGALADRVPRRRVMVAADLLRVATSAALAVAVAGQATPLVIVAALTVVAALGEALFTPAFSASLTQLLPEGERAAGNALNLANGAAGGMLGPLIGGVLVAAFGPGRVLAVDALTFLFSAVVVGSTTIPRVIPGASVPITVAERESPRSGWRIVAGMPEIRRLTILAAVLNLCTGPTSVLLVVLVLRRLHRGPAIYGLLDGCFAAGMLAGVVLVTKLARRDGDGPIVTGLVALGAAFVLVGAVPAPWWSAAMFVVVGVAVAVVNSFLPARFQSLVPEHEQGRVFGVVGSLASGLRPLGLGAAGPLIAVAGPAGGYAVCGRGHRRRDAGVPSPVAVDSRQRGCAGR